MIVNITFLVFFVCVNRRVFVSNHAKERSRNEYLDSKKGAHARLIDESNTLIDFSLAHSHGEVHMYGSEFFVRMVSWRE